MNTGAISSFGVSSFVHAAAGLGGDSTGGIVSSGVFKMNLTTKEAIWSLGSPRLFQRLRYHKWIKPLYQSRDALYPMSQLNAAQRRLEEGERPPPLPSEIRESTKRLRANELCCA